MQPVKLHYEGADYVLSRSSRPPPVPGVVSVSEMAAVKCNATGTRWSCPLCSNARTCPHIQGARGALQTADYSTYLHELKLKQWLDPSTGKRRCACDSKDAIPQRLHEAPQFAGAQSSSCDVFLLGMSTCVRSNAVVHGSSQLAHRNNTFCSCVTSCARLINAP